MRVRKGRWSYIIHANYKFYVDDNHDACQTVRVGRVISHDQMAVGLWPHMVEVGEELKARLNREGMVKHAQHAIDQCFANLPSVKSC